MVDNLNFDIEIIHGSNTIINEETLHFVKPYNLFVTLTFFMMIVILSGRLQLQRHRKRRRR